MADTTSRSPRAHYTTLTDTTLVGRSPFPGSGRAVGYRPVTKTLHWLTVAALVVQFVIGYTLEVDDSGQGRGRGHGRGGESGRGRDRGRGGDDLEVFGDGTLLTAHVVVDVTILVLASLRLLVRWRTELPPWAESLSPVERTIATWTEGGLYLLLFPMPLSRLWLVLVSDDASGVHVASHIAFFSLVAVHLGLVLKHQLIGRDRLLRRML